MQIAGIKRSLWRGAVSSISFYVLLSLSRVIATFEFLANSAAIIIGAMIVAPLMGLIIAIAYSMVAANQRLLRHSVFTNTRNFTGFSQAIDSKGFKIQN